MAKTLVKRGYGRIVNGNQTSKTAQSEASDSTDDQPLSVEDVKKHLEIAEADDQHDAQIVQLIYAARQQFEHDTGRATTVATYDYFLDQFPECGYITLPLRPVASLASVKYTDGAAAQATLAVSVADLDGSGQRVALKYDQSWPSIPTFTDAVVVRFTAGYSTAIEVPELWRQAMLLQVGKWFEDREMMGAAYSVDSFDQAYERIIRRLQRNSYP